MTTSTEDYKEILNRLKKQFASSQFLRWWLGELTDMVPAWVRSQSSSPEHFTLVPIESVGSRWTPPENVEMREFALTVPKARVLTKTISLPIATEENLREVLMFQMELHTPFSPNQVYFGYVVSRRDFERGRLSVELAVTPREAIDIAMRTLEGLGVTVRAVFSDELLDKGHWENLLPTAVKSVPSSLRKGANPWLAALVGLLVFAAMALPIFIKREAVLQLLPWVEKTKKAAEAVDSVRRELDARVEEHNYLLEMRQTNPTVIQTLEELTRILPDDTWVSTLDIKGKELLIQGETASSAKLIGIFEKSSIFADASFRSPLFKGQVSGTERFQLALQIRPAAAPLLVAAVPQPSASQPGPSGFPAGTSSSPIPKASEPASSPASGGEKQ